MQVIDHVSVAVGDLAVSGVFYEKVLAPLGLARLVSREHSIGFGKRYPEFWLNHRAGMRRVPADTGNHLCLRAPSEDAVRKFFAAALDSGGLSAGEPGPRAAAMTNYFAAFIYDPDGNKIEAAHFPPAS
jgi:catechol 2,3-dioxygenase-like lactoylglutathione lyase family enzyme